MFNNFPTWSVFLIYAVLAAGIVFFSKKLADYVDALDKKTKISGAFIGAVLLAAVTSLPELFTSISATLLVKDGEQLVIGNILGSNLFNLAIVGFALILFFRLFAKSKIEYKTQFIVITACLIIYAIIAGIMIHIAIYELLPSATEYKRYRIIYLFYILGFILVLINLFLF